MIINSYSELIHKLGDYPNSGQYFFRGLSVGQSVIPSIHYGKPIISVSKLQTIEKGLISGFCDALKNNYNFLSEEADINETDTWFLARHFGLKSRLIDFTYDLIVALQFAFEYSKYTKALVVALKAEALEQMSQEKISCSPFDLNKSCMIRPALNYTKNYDTILGTSRMFIQGGRFLFQPLEECYKPLTKTIPSQFWKEFEIPFSAFADIKQKIYKSGTDMNKSLLKENHGLDNRCKILNEIYL